MKAPRIVPPDGGTDFHDSSLIDIQVSPDLRTITVILSTPDELEVQHLWQLTFSRVLRFEYEHLGDGSPPALGQPIEVYDVYDHRDHPRRERWIQRLKLLDVSDREARNVRHIVLASSFFSGCVERDDVEGILIVCRDATVQPAPAQYKGSEFSRPWIPAAPDDDGSDD